MMTFQFLPENVNKSRGSLKLVLPHCASYADCFLASAVFTAASQEKKKDWKKGPFLANHAMDLKQLTYVQLISNHSMSD